MTGVPNENGPRRWNRWGTAMMFSAVAIVLAPVFGTGIKLVKLFSSIDQDGMADPAEMAWGISRSLEISGISFYLTAISAGIALFCLVLFLRRKKLDEKDDHDAKNAD